MPQPVTTRRRRLALTAGAAVVASVMALTTPAAAATPADTTVAPGAPGALSYFDLARKDCVGTAASDSSKVWFTVANGVLSDVYEPTIDNTDVESLQFVVTDGSTFTDLQERDTTYTVSSADNGMACTVTSTSAAHGYQLVTTYVTDPRRDAVVMHTRLLGDTQGLHVYARLDGHVNGNGGGGTDNGGGDDGSVTASGVPVIGDAGTVSEAVNRDYAVPTYMALDSPTLGSSSVGYEGTSSDGLTQLDAEHTLDPTYSSAPDGHVVATADVTPTGPTIDLVLGFGRTGRAAVNVATASLRDGYLSAYRDYRAGWAAYDDGLDDPFAQDPASAKVENAYWLSANVLKASVDKTFRGAVVASLASPWGQAVSAGDLHGGEPVYFGSYREVFARDLYEAVTGFLADGDRADARAATLFLFRRQQLSDGRMPRNSLLNGQAAPDTGGDQLDETAYPILMTFLTGLDGREGLYRNHVRPAADFLVAHGPSFGNERWEEQTGYSPSTIAAEIAGLASAGFIASEHHDQARSRLYYATADEFRRTVEDETVTDTGPYSTSPYFIRLSKTGDPNATDSYSLGNGSVTVDQRDVVDGGFQELVRLGELKADDPAVHNSLKVLDSTISANTPSGTGFYRYGTSDPGSEDGYGDCWTPDATDCTTDGAPWPPSDHGSGHLWPVLSGERAETSIALGRWAPARKQLDFMLNSASGVGLVPEQVWEDADQPASPYGSDPTTASIGFTDGGPAGSAAPLTWAQAQLLRLILDWEKGHVTDRPFVTRYRYVAHRPPGRAPLTITSPSGGDQVDGTTTVTGTTSPHAKVDVLDIDTDLGGSATATTFADRSGAFSVDVPTPFGANVITASATKGRTTGFAQTRVVGQLSGGTSVLDVDDPVGDDDGPGTYQYPTASDFHPGAFDLTRFEVLTENGTVYLRASLSDLSPTFSDPLGAQLLDVYVHDPEATDTSTAASYPSRNYAIADADAWSERVKVQGFADPQWVDADGGTVGTVQGVVTSQSAGTVTIALPEDEFGTPGPGWSFTVALTGQDGYGQDGARAFTTAPGDYTFGVCAAGGTPPICAQAPNTVPKVMDTVTPDGIDQSSELDPTLGPVTLHGVAVP